MPSAAPIKESSRLSVNSCRITRLLPAPIASRTAISFSLAAPRASSNPATFAQAMNNTIPTAAISKISGSPNRSRNPVNPLCAGSKLRRGPSVFFHAGFAPCVVSLTNQTFIAACACALEMPGRSRPTTVNHHDLPPICHAQRHPNGVTCCSGTHKSTDFPGVSRVNPRSATPTIVNTTLFKRICSPQNACRAAERALPVPVIQYRNSRCVPVFSSSGCSVLPSAARRPVSGNNFPIQVRPAQYLPVRCHSGPSVAAPQMLSHLKTGLCVLQSLETWGRTRSSRCNPPPFFQAHNPRSRSCPTSGQ